MTDNRILPRTQSTEEGGVVADIDGIDATYRILAENGANEHRYESLNLDVYFGGR